jgi:hypothetical protein
LQQQVGESVDRVIGAVAEAFDRDLHRRLVGRGDVGQQDAWLPIVIVECAALRFFTPK